MAARRHGEHFGFACSWRWGACPCGPGPWVDGEPYGRPGATVGSRARSRETRRSSWGRPDLATCNAAGARHVPAGRFGEHIDQLLFRHGRKRTGLSAAVLEFLQPSFAAVVVPGPAAGHPVVALEAVDRLSHVPALRR